MGTDPTPEQLQNYFVAAKAIVYDDDGNMLTMLRGATAPTNPLSWDLPGGILEYGEGLEECIERETLEETGITLDSIRVLHAIARMNSIGEFWTTVYYTAHARTHEVMISWEHDEYKWLSPDQFLQLEASQRIKETVEKFIDLRERGKL